MTSDSRRTARLSDNSDLVLAYIEAVRTTLKQVRLARGMSLNDLAEKTGYSISALSRLESGSQPGLLRFDYVVAVCKALRVSPHAVLRHADTLFRTTTHATWDRDLPSDMGADNRPEKKGNVGSGHWSPAARVERDGKIVADRRNNLSIYQIAKASSLFPHDRQIRTEEIRRLTDHDIRFTVPIQAHRSTPGRPHQRRGVPPGYIPASGGRHGPKVRRTRRTMAASQDSNDGPAAAQHTRDTVNRNGVSDLPPAAVAQHSDPDAARAELADALRALRERAGRTQGSVAKPLGWSAGKILRVEGCQSRISVQDLRALLAEIGVTDTDVVEGHVVMCRASHGAPSGTGVPGRARQRPVSPTNVVQFTQASAADCFQRAGGWLGTVSRRHVVVLATNVTYDLDTGQCVLVLAYDDPAVRGPDRGRHDGTRTG
jgi:transcriptional regulator with XRE-family HTH domain